MRKSLGVKIILHAFTLALFSSAAYAVEPYGYKGVPLGATQATLMKKQPKLRCEVIPDQFKYLGDASCMGESTYAGVDAFVVAYFYSNSLGHVEVKFDSGKFSEVNASLIEKYGQSIIAEKTELSNRMGVKFENETNMWKRGNGVIEINKYGKKISESKVSITSTVYIEEFKKRNQSNIKEKSGDL